MMQNRMLMLSLAVFAGTVWAEPYRTYVAPKGEGSCGAGLIAHRDDGILCGIKGWYHLSEDGGRSWRPLYKFTKGAGTNLLRLKDGRLLSIVSEAAENIYTNRLKASNFYAYFSSDEGRSWSGRVPLSTDNRRLYLMNDRVMRLKSGRILVSFSLHPNELLKDLKNFEAVGWVNAFYSDDEGATWHEGRRRPTSAADQLCEPNVFEKSDGTLVMLSRTGKGYLYRCDSTDGGESWSVERPTTLRSAVAPFYVKKDPFTGWVFVAWDNSFPGPVHQYPRSPLSLAVSRDEGDTWEFVCDIENDPMSSYGYPSIHFTEKSVIVSYYEEIGFRAFNAKEQRCKVTVFDRGEMSVEKVIREPLGYPKDSRWRHWEGVDNVRDLGGLKTHDGRTLKKGMIYRSQALNDNAICSTLSEACMRTPGWFATEYGERNSAELRARIDANDVTGSCARISKKLKTDKEWWRKGELRGTVESRRKVLEETGLKTELDLRWDTECWGMTGSPLGPSVRWLHMPCKGVFLDWFAKDEGKAFFSRCFREFLKRENYPFDIHCIAGADRTGCLVVLLTGLLGVTDEEIENDYLMTSLSSSGHRSRERFRNRTKALDAFPGKTFAEKTVAYADVCGITRDEIDVFRAIMLQSER